MNGTEIFIVAGASIVIAVDIFLAATKRETISQVTWRTSKRWPLIPFAVGVLCGHLFWQG